MTDQGQVTELEQNQNIEAPVEHVVPQAKVNSLIGGAKKASYEKGLNEGYKQAMAELNNQSQPTPQYHAQGQNQSSMGGMQQMNPDEIRKIVAEESQRMQQLAIGNQIANDFNAKLEAGKQKYADFDQAIAPIKESLHAIPHIVLLANATDNTADVMYELAQNPSKIADIQKLFEISPRLGQEAMAKLSNSIKRNESTAPQANSAHQPLSQPKASSFGADNGGEHQMSVKDFKKMAYLRS